MRKGSGMRITLLFAVVSIFIGVANKDAFKNTHTKISKNDDQSITQDVERFLRKGKRIFKKTIRDFKESCSDAEETMRSKIGGKDE